MKNRKRKREESAVGIGRADVAMLLNRKPLANRSISFAKPGRITLICPECRKAAVYTKEESSFPEFGLIDDGDYDSYLERMDYFALSAHAVCPHCKKDFTVNGWLNLDRYETYDSRGRCSSFTQEDAESRLPRRSTFSLWNRRKGDA